MQLVLEIEDFSDKMYKTIADHITSACFKAKPNIESAIRLMTEEHIIRSPEYIALTSDSIFRAQIGIGGGGETLTPKIDRIQAMLEILEAVSLAIEVNVQAIKYSGGHFTGGISIGIIRQDLSEVLGLPIANFMSENGFVVPWLTWLLTAGQGVVINDYHFTSGNKKSLKTRSRTGLGFMVRGGSWKVPAPGGTYEDNFLTRALSDSEPEILAILEKEIGANL